MIDNILVLFCFFFLLSYMRTTTSQDSLAVNQSIRDGQTLVSARGTFELGFFSPGKSTGRYLGMWYKNLSPLTVVWVANRETPLHNNNSGVLKFNEKGVLVILNGTNNSSTVWSSNNISKSNKAINDSNSIIAQLLDTGNLVLKTGQDTTKEDNVLWQSFDYPSHAFLPGMKFGRNLETGLDRFASSWKSADDPAKGEYSLKVDIRGYPQVVILKRSVIKFRFGSWNGVGVTGNPTQQLKQKQRYYFAFNAKEVYLKYEVVDSSVVTIYTLNPSGIVQALAWTSQRSGRIVINIGGGEDSCDTYAMCGVNSVCNMDGNVPKCECLEGFVSQFPEQWNISYWSSGCAQRNNESVCGNSNTRGFLRYEEMKLPNMFIVV